MEFKGKNVVITGGASGIGRAAVRGFAAAGAAVYFGDINTDGGDETARLVADAGYSATFLPVDLAEEASIHRFAEAVHGRIGRADAVINVAGWDIQQPFMENSVDFMRKVIDINLLGTILVTRAFLPPMMEARRGRIVTTSSDAGRVGSSGETVYAGAKGGIIAFTKSLAREMARYGINVNCVAPGPTDTPLFAQAPEKLRDALVRAIPFRRLAQPSEIADCMMFFASDRASYITGQVISVSGGLTMSG